MSFPDWWEALLLAAAAWRTFQLVSVDDILDRPRRYVTGKLSETWNDFIDCSYCSGAWIASAWWIAWLIYPHGTLVVATPLVLSVGVIGAHKLFASE